MQRRAFITLLGGATLAWPLIANAQPPERMRRIGLLQGLAASDQDWQRRLSAFRQGLAQLGWAEGRNIILDVRYADGNPERLPALAADLVAAQAEMIVTNAAQPIEAARNVTSTIPIVMASVGDALGAGYVASLARPGGNVTGLTLMATEQSAKRLELMKDISPGLMRIAVIWNENASGHRFQMKEMEPASRVLGLELKSVPIQKAGDIDAALRSVMQTQAVVTMDDPVIQSNRGRIVDWGMRERIPVVGEFRPMAAAGALMTYGPDQVDLWRRSAAYVDKILKGAKPADLPVEQPTKFELVINLKTAKALGIAVPPTLIARADEVIE